MQTNMYNNPYEPRRQLNRNEAVVAAIVAFLALGAIGAAFYAKMRYDEQVIYNEATTATTMPYTAPNTVTTEPSTSYNESYVAPATPDSATETVESDTLASTPAETTTTTTTVVQ